MALAFCNADLLFELDKSGEIIFAAGATGAFIGKTSAELIGSRLRDHVAEGSRGLFDRLLGNAAHGRRIDSVHIQLAGAEGPSLPLSLSGFQMNELGGQFYLSFRIPTVRTERYGERLNYETYRNLLNTLCILFDAKVHVSDIRAVG
ncbi:MAG: PAS domain-containing protein [Alphaproteobacteria bacterium]